MPTWMCIRCEGTTDLPDSRAECARAEGPHYWVRQDTRAELEGALGRGLDGKCSLVGPPAQVGTLAFRVFHRTDGTPIASLYVDGEVLRCSPAQVLELMRRHGVIDALRAAGGDRWGVLTGKGFGLK